MWAYENTFYQFYPLGLVGAPTYAPAVGDTAAEDAERSQHRIKKLAAWAPYLRELGVGAIILNPVFASSWHGYDTRDLRQIDCRLGTNEDFVDVVKELHAHGVRILLDAVFNHVGRDFWAFRDVREKRWDSPYVNWFHISFDGNTHFNDGFWYEGWEGNQDLVKLNLQNPAVVDYLLDSVRMWRHDLGIDGLRLDVAYSLDHDFLRRLRGLAGELAAEPAPAVITEAVARAEENARAGAPASDLAAARELLSDRTFFLLGETLHGDYNQIMNDEMLHSCTNYECYKGLYSSFNSMNLFEIGHSLNRQFGPEQWCIYRGKHLLAFSDNHDVSRLASILTNKRHLVPAYGLLLGMPGIPCLYYGSEWGQLGEKGQGHDADMKLRPALDSPARAALVEEEHQIARLAGTTDQNAPLGALSCAVAHADMDELMGSGPNELTALIARMVSVRAGSRALGYGAYHNVNIQNKQLLFERVAEADGEHPRERVLVAVNADDQPHTFYDGTLNCWFEDMLAEGPAGAHARELTGSFEVPAYGVVWLREVSPDWTRPAEAVAAEGENASAGTSATAAEPAEGAAESSAPDAAAPSSATPAATASAGGGAVQEATGDTAAASAETGSKTAEPVADSATATAADASPVAAASSSTAGRGLDGTSDFGIAHIPAVPADENAAESEPKQKLYLMCAAESSQGGRRDTLGWYHGPITAYGLNQAHNIGRALVERGAKIDTWVASSDACARTTLERVMLEMDASDKPYIFDHNLITVTGEEGKPAVAERLVQGLAVTATHEALAVIDRGTIAAFIASLPECADAGQHLADASVCVLTYRGGAFALDEVISCA